MAPGNVLYGVRHLTTVVWVVAFLETLYKSALRLYAYSNVPKIPSPCTMHTHTHTHTHTHAYPDAHAYPHTQRF